MLLYKVKQYDKLTLDELYSIMVIRQEVFIVEQECPYLDADNKDQKCHHVLGTDPQGKLHSYARIVPKGISYEKYYSIGRVITSSAYRDIGEGKRLMQYCISEMKKLYNTGNCKISAQVHALPFYLNLGFAETGDRYDEDGIPHTAMILSI